MVETKDKPKKDKPTKDNPELQRALNRIVRYLSLRDHSRFELQQKLRRTFTSDIIAQALEIADSWGYIPENAVLAERLTAALNRQLKSRTYIENQLRRRGLPPTPTNSEVEVDKARALVEKKFGPALELRGDIRVQAMRYLRNRGFRDRSIRQVFYEQP